MSKQKDLDIGPSDDLGPAQIATSPECLSAAVLTICQNRDHAQITELIDELKKQSAAVHVDDLSRAESMLITQAHTLDSLFASMASRALTAGELNRMERYFRLALKSQSQARATLQTLADLKMPNRVAFIRQANIGNQVQVNNGHAPPRAQKNQNEPNELLGVEHEERVDTRAAGTAGCADSAMATVGAKHRSDEREG